MALPFPQLGLVLSYAYLWHHEHRAGREEGVKTRPCVIVMALVRTAEDDTLVRVLPVTHTPPSDGTRAFEVPTAVKRHLGLDDARSWIIHDELNEFIWPGFDLRPIPGDPARFDYGMLPPRLFEQIQAKLRAFWSSGQGKATSRE